MRTHRPVKEHDLPDDLGHIGQRVWRQKEAARVDYLRDELLAVLLHGLSDQLLADLEVVLVLGDTEAAWVNRRLKERIHRATWRGLGTHVVGDTGVNEVPDELHHTAVRVPVVQGGGRNGTLDQVHDDLAAQEGDGAPLDKPAAGGGAGVQVRGVSLSKSRHTASRFEIRQERQQ